MILHDYLKKSRETAPRKIALIYEDRYYSYAELDNCSTFLARHLVRSGIKPQDRVVIFMDNIPEAVIALYAALKAGAIFVIVSGALKSSKLRYILNDTGARVLVSQAYKREIVRDAVASTEMNLSTIWLEDEQKIQDSNRIPLCRWQEVVKHKNDNITLPEVNDTNLAALIYTSGSTGEPKGIMSSHFNMISAAGSIIEYLENTSDEVILNVLPLSFDYGLYQILMSIMIGGTLVLEKTFMYPVRILQQLEQHKVTGFPVVPTLLTMILNNSSLSRFKLPSLRYISSTGAYLSPAKINAFRSLFPHVQVYSMYGLTECKRVSYLPPHLLDTIPDSVGIPMSRCEVSVVNEQGDKVETGQTGELVIRGPNVMQGYWNDSKLTARIFRKDPVSGETHLYSGDLFRQDKEGYLYFVGRNDDLIKSKGERVSPKEVENMIARHPAVTEVAVIGVPDDILGKAIKAFIVKHPGDHLTSREILKYCADNMEAIMVPKYVEFLDSLPRTENGKVDTKRLEGGEG